MTSKYIVNPVARLFWLSTHGEPKCLVSFLGNRKKVYIDLTDSDILELETLLDGDLGNTTSSLLLSLDKNEIIYKSTCFDAFDFDGAFSRQIISYCNSTQFDEAVKLSEKIRNRRFIIIGVGGAGCNVILQLLALGVYRFILVDPDLVETSNLNRQVLFSPTDIGRKKVEVAKEYINRFCSGFAEVFDIAEDFLSCKFSKKLITEVDFAVISADNDQPKIRIKAAQIFYTSKTPYCFLSYFGSLGSVGPMIVDTNGFCGCCLLSKMDLADSLILVKGKTAKNIAASSLSINSLIAAIFSNEVVKWARGQSLKNITLKINCNTSQVQTEAVKGLSSCKICGSRR